VRGAGEQSGGHGLGQLAPFEVIGEGEGLQGAGASAAQAAKAGDDAPVALADEHTVAAEAEIAVRL
jgi:hypothetical protein